MDLTNFMRPFFPICDIFCIFAEQKKMISKVKP